MRTLKISLVLLSAMTFSGCATISTNKQAPKLLSTAQVTPLTESGKTLRQLPEPAGKILVSMYKFRDKTGQFKSSPSNAYSTVVTQGAGSILLKALLESGWFTPLEREGLNDLITERKIREKELGKKSIPNLYSAPLMLEGGIIAYDTNMRTGGIGASYLGIGASSQYREDQVTVNLRLVNVNTGEILHSVNATKSVYSQKVGSSVFNFVRFKELLEFEAGYSFNEPAQFCVIDAIESALIQLIVKGLEDHHWELKNPKDINHPIFKKYLGTPVAS